MAKRRGDEVVFIVSDLHFPWHKQSALNIVIHHIKIIKPEYVIQIGDIYDLYCMSRFAKSLNIMTPEMELKKGRKLALQFWDRVSQAVPGAKMYQLLGNHDIRMRSKVKTNLPEMESLFADDDRYLFPEVTTILDPREILYINGVAYHHGHKVKAGTHLEDMQNNMVLGHTHRGGIITANIFGKTFWELNCGWLGDRSQAPFHYTPYKQKTLWTLGFGLMHCLFNRNIPEFIHIEGK